MTGYIKTFSEIGIADVERVGGKNASLGEMFNHLAAKGVSVPNGFATTAFAFERFLSRNDLHALLHEYGGSSSLAPACFVSPLIEKIFLSHGLLGR